MKILVNSYIKKMDKIGMRSKKPCVAKPQKGWRHAVSKFRIKTISYFGILYYTATLKNIIMLNPN